MVVGGVKAAFSVELNVCIQVPVLQSESKPLVMEQFWIELVLRGTDKDQVVIEGTLGAVWLSTAFGVAVGDGAEVEEE
jgi:hypothetical protein